MSPKPPTAKGRNGRVLLTPREVAHRGAIIRQARRWYLARADTWFPARVEGCAGLDNDQVGMVRAGGGGMPHMVKASEVYKVKPPR